jgi:hypothetical protein
MLGLVLTGWPRTTIAPAAVAPVAVAHPLTLEEELIARGLTPIPLPEVRRFQNKVRDDWEATSPNYFGYWERVPDWLVASLEPPADVMRDIERARTIPNSVIYAERFEADPFVFIRRIGEKGRVERACFAAFRTSFRRS